MIKYGISCALEMLPEYYPVIFRGDINHVASEVAHVGYDGIELFIRNPRRYNSKVLNMAAADNRLSFCAISTGLEYNANHLCLISDDVNNRRMAIDRLKEHLELGAAIGCPVVIGIIRGNIPDFERYQEYKDRYIAALSELNDYAEQAGTTIVVESIIRYINNYLNSVIETAKFIRDINLKNITLHIDTHSMLVEDRNFTESIRKTADILHYVHFSDSNRGYPGAGNIDFKEVMKALNEVGYDGYVCIECQPYPTQYECARRGLEYIKALEKIILLEQMSIKEEDNGK